MNKARIRRLIRLLLASPVALLVVLIARLVRPIVTVRFGALKSDRVGHFVLETELMLHEQILGIKPRPKRSIDLYYAPQPVSNSQVETMWGRVIVMLPRWLMVPVFRLNSLLPLAERHRIPTATSTCLDVLNLLDRTDPLLQFTTEEEARGRQLLDALGVGNQPYVCVIVRDETYYKEALPNQDLSYHSFRNCDVDTYVEGLEALAEQGLYVLRMGAVVGKPLRSSHPRLIDYANSPLRSAFGDVFLGANCKFCISDGLGFYAIPAAFRRPNAYVNYSPFHMFYSSRASDLGIAKIFAEVGSGRVVPIRELAKYDISNLTRTERIAAAGLQVIDNSPQEIKQLLLEMNARLDGTWVANPLDDELQQQYWSRFLEAIGPDGRAIHGEIRARFGAEYLRSHREWIA